MDERIIAEDVPQQTPVQGAPAPAPQQQQQAPVEFDGIISAPKEIEVPVQSTQDWISQLPEELRNHPSLQKFKSPAEVFQSYVNLEKMLGKDKVPVPADDAPPEEWDRFYEKLGRPPTPDEYRVEYDGVNPDSSFLKDYKEWAHKSGLSQRQASDLLKHYAEYEKQFVENLQKDFVQRANKAKQDLMIEWGPNYEDRVKAAERAIAQASKVVPGLAEWLEASGAKADPVFVKVMQFFGSGLAEDMHRGGGRAITPESAEAEINKLLSDSAFKQKYLSGDKAAVQQITSLMEAAYGNEEVR